MSDVFLLPDPGEGLTEADIVSWKVAAGDSVTVNQILVEIETAKSLVELPSPHAGTISELLVEEGATVEVGTPIVRFGPVGGEAPAQTGSASAGTAGARATSSTAEAAPAAASEGASGATLVGYGAVASSSKRRPRKNAGAGLSAAPAEAAAPADAASADTAVPPAAPADAGAASADAAAAAAGGDAPAAEAAGRQLAKPPVRKLAKDRGVDLGSVTATGPNGEVTRADLLSHLDGGGGTGGTAAPPAPAAAPAPPAAAEREERIPVKGVKKAMANAMVASAFTSPHVTIGVEVDVTGMMDLVRRLKSDRALGETVRVSPLLIVAKAVTRAAMRYPYMNARMDGDEVTLRHYVNLGIAAATDRGLIVPNIKDADRMGLRELGESVGELVEVARSGRTSPSAQAGGTITITNVGVFGVDWGTPIINPGESAIVAVGRVQRKPWVVDDAVVPREVMTVTVSADHRVVDGETISRFLRDVADVLEDPVRLLL